MPNPAEVGALEAVFSLFAGEEFHRLRLLFGDRFIDTESPEAESVCPVKGLDVQGDERSLLDMEELWGEMEMLCGHVNYLMRDRFPLKIGRDGRELLGGPTAQ